MSAWFFNHLFGFGAARSSEPCIGENYVLTCTLAVRCALASDHLVHRSVDRLGFWLLDLRTRNSPVLGGADGAAGDPAALLSVQRPAAHAAHPASLGLLHCLLGLGVAHLLSSSLGVAVRPSIAISRANLPFSLRPSMGRPSSCTYTHLGSLASGSSQA
jgi:hypothetical protein